MDTLGAIIGPAIAFIVLAVFAGNFRAVFWLATIPGCIAVMLIILYIRERPRTVKGRVEPPRLSPAAIDGRFRRYMLVIAVFSLGNTSNAFLILRAGDTGITDEIIPLTYILFNVTYFASSTPFGVLADRIGMRTMIALGFLLYAMVYASLAIEYTPIHIWILFSFYGLFKSMSDGTQRAHLATVAPEDMKATAFGIYHMVVGLFLLPASIIGEGLWDGIAPPWNLPLRQYHGAIFSFLIFSLRKERPPH